MERFETEEQQVEAIKKFWKENGMAIIVGAVIGLGGLWGWRYYNEHKIAGMEESSELYQQRIEALQEENGFTQAVEMIEADPDNGYSLMAALLLAQQATERKDLVEAAKQLKFVAGQAQEPAIQAMANLRLARVQLASDSLDEALTTLELVTDEAFAGQVQEIKGDIYLQQSLFDKARAAYSAALEQNSNNNQVKMKLDNLAVAANG